MNGNQLFCGAEVWSVDTVSSRKGVSEIYDAFAKLVLIPASVFEVRHAPFTTHKHHHSQADCLYESRPVNRTLSKASDKWRCNHISVTMLLPYCVYCHWGLKAPGLFITTDLRSWSVILFCSKDIVLKPVCMWVSQITTTTGSCRESYSDMCSSFNILLQFTFKFLFLQHHC